MLRKRAIWFWLVLAVGVAMAGRAAASEEMPQASPAPVHVFAQAGVGLLEIGHVEVGVFVGPHVTIEGMAASDGVFGGRYGGGCFALIGHAQGRPPKHALLLGLRLMLNADGTFDSHGEDLSSYGVIPVGYSYLGQNGLFVRSTAGLAIIRNRTTDQNVLAGGSPSMGHEIAVGGLMFTASVGYAF